MTRTLSVRNRQSTRAVNVRRLRQIALWALEELFGDVEFELGIHLVGTIEMACLNETFLNHKGSTDVITFDHRDEVGQASCLPGRAERGGLAPNAAPDGAAGRRDACPTLCGEIFISLDDAVKQARQFRTTWTGELIRYLLHGLLHLHGFDDLAPAARRTMKREENRLLRRAGQAFDLRLLARR